MCVCDCCRPNRHFAATVSDECDRCEFSGRRKSKLPLAGNRRCRREAASFTSFTFLAIRYIRIAVGWAVEMCGCETVAGLTDQTLSCKPHSGATRRPRRAACSAVPCTQPMQALQAVVPPCISAAHEALQRRARNSAACRLLRRVGRRRGTPVPLAFGEWATASS